MCAHITTTKNGIQKLPCLTQFPPLPSFPVHSLPYPKENHYLVLYCHKLVLSVSEPPINRIIQWCALFCIWLLSLNNVVSVRSSILLCGPVICEIMT